MKKTMAFLLAIITLFLLSAPAFATSNSTWDTVTADDKVVIIVPKGSLMRQWIRLFRNSRERQKRWIIKNVFAMSTLIMNMKRLEDTQETKCQEAIDFLQAEAFTFRIPEDRACLVVYRFLCRNRTIGYLSV